MHYYQIKELSEITSLTVRTLQYYDEIGLLKPSKRSDAGYRLYSNDDLLLLQQIITLKYGGFSLGDIKNIIQQADFDVLESLRQQTQALMKQAQNIHEAAKLLNYIANQVEANQTINWKSTAKIINILEMNLMTDKTVNQIEQPVNNSELGKKSEYDQRYNPERLYPIPRAGKRREIGISPDTLPFYGFDCWNHYEVSWLSKKGKPIVATAEIIYDCNSPNIIESKSLKLYFNSFNNTMFSTADSIASTIKEDLEKHVGSAVKVTLILVGEEHYLPIQNTFPGICIDHHDIECSQYTVQSNFLTTTDEIVSETLYSDLLKSNCLVTNQPDWGSVQIVYKGKKISQEGLLKYIVSFRNHNEFHEQCIERIFVDILSYCHPEELTVYGRYTRRGGLDINPYRSTKEISSHHQNIRLYRQ